jgi:trehalose/maltose transport system permease protein
MRSSHRLAFLYMLPSFVFVALFSLFPIIDSLRLSFYRLILTLPWLGQKMVGWENYRDIWQDPVAFQSFKTTLIFVAVTITFELLFGLAIALVLNETFRGRGLMRAIVLIPWAIPTVVSAQTWRFLFNDRYALSGAAGGSTFCLGRNHGRGDLENHALRGANSAFRPSDDIR